MNISRSSMDMQKRNSPVRSVRRNSTPWLTWGNTWSVSSVGFSSLTYRFPLCSGVFHALYWAGYEALPYFSPFRLVEIKCNMSGSITKLNGPGFHARVSFHRCYLFPLQNIAIKASRISVWEIKMVWWPYSRTPTFFNWSFWVNLFWVKCILCCSAHKRHAFYMWNLWEIVQTQYVTQGALLAAFWREALQMWGKEGATARRRPRGWSSVRPGGAAARGGFRGAGCQAARPQSLQTGAPSIVLSHCSVEK